MITIKLLNRIYFNDMIKNRCFYLKDISNKFHTLNSACLILLKVLAATKHISIVSMKSTTMKNNKDKLQKNVNIQSNHTQLQLKIREEK